MRVSLVTVSGREIAAVDADPSWTKHDLCSHLPGFEGARGACCHIVLETRQLTGETTLEQIGAEDVDVSFPEESPITKPDLSQ